MINWILQDPVWKANSCWDCQDVACLLQKGTVITLFTTDSHCHWTHTDPVHSITARFLNLHLNADFHLLQLPPSSLLSSRFPTKIYMRFSSFPYVLKKTSQLAPFFMVTTRWNNCSHSTHFHAGPQSNVTRQTHFSFRGYRLASPLALIFQYQTTSFAATLKAKYMKHVLPVLITQNSVYVSAFKGSLRKCYSVLW